MLDNLKFAVKFKQEIQIGLSAVCSSLPQFLPAFPPSTGRPPSHGQLVGPLSLIPVISSPCPLLQRENEKKEKKRGQWQSANFVHFPGSLTFTACNLFLVTLL